MSSSPRYKFFITNIIYLLLISQIWTNMLPCLYLISDKEVNPVELVSSEDSEKEEKKEKEENENKKETEDKIHMEFANFLFHKLHTETQIIKTTRQFLSHPPEITTPPPESV